MNFLAGRSKKHFLRGLLCLLTIMIGVNTGEASRTGFVDHSAAYRPSSFLSSGITRQTDPFMTPGERGLALRSRRLGLSLTRQLQPHCIYDYDVQGRPTTGLSPSTVCERQCNYGGAFSETSKNEDKTLITRDFSLFSTANSRPDVHACIDYDDTRQLSAQKDNYSRDATFTTTDGIDRRTTTVTGTTIIVGDCIEASTLNNLFQGLWTDPTTGIAYARNRWYDARNASWLSEDPKGAVDSVNLYAFVGWGPHMGTDPMGLCVAGCVGDAWALWAGGAILAGATTAYFTLPNPNDPQGRTLAEAHKDAIVESASQKAEDAKFVLGLALTFSEEFGLVKPSHFMPSNETLGSLVNPIPPQVDPSPPGYTGEVQKPEILVNPIPQQVDTSLEGIPAEVQKPEILVNPIPDTPIGMVIFMSGAQVDENGYLRTRDGRFAPGGENTGNTATAARGREAHKKYQLALGEGYDYEFVLPSGKRADAVDLDNRIVRELKPDNPRTISDGKRQLERYRLELQEEFGGEWTSFIDVYRT